MAGSQTVRQQQVARMLVAEISDIIHREMNDPRLGFATLVAAVAVETLLLGVMGYVLVATKWQEPALSPTHEVPADSGPRIRP